MKGSRILFFVIVVLLALLPVFLWLIKRNKIYTARPGQVVELSFRLDKKFEFGEYYFDLDNGKTSTYPLCFCLAEKNMYPPDCAGDVEYIYNNTPGKMCVPLHIGAGRCTATRIGSLAYATVLYIPLEYGWTKPCEKIVMGIKVPSEAPEKARLAVEVTVFKQNELGKLVVYRKYEQAIIVKQ